MTGGSSPRSGTSSPVFGSRSPTPSTPVAPTTNAQSQISMPVDTQVAGKHQVPEPSDVPHLIRTHETLGYRAGLSDGKDHTGGVQAAFDQGYPLGAALGMRVGKLLRRLVEPGVLSQNNSDPNAQGQNRQNVEYTLQDAVHELSITKLIAEIEQLGILNHAVTLESSPAVRDNRSIASNELLWCQISPEDLFDKLSALVKWSEIAGRSPYSVAKIN